MTRLLPFAAALGLAAVTVLPAAAVAAEPGPEPGGHHGHSAAAHGAHGRHGHPAAFTATGTLTAVSGQVLTVADKGGSRDLHGRSVSVTVASGARVRRGDADAMVADLQPGDHVSLRGTRAGDGSLTATRVNAAAPEPSPSAGADTTSQPSSQPSSGQGAGGTASAAATPTDTASPSVTPTA